MYNLFSLPRFSRLFQKHTAEHWKSYLMGAGVLAGALLLVLGFLSYLNGGAPNTRAQAVFFGMFMLGGGFLFTSNIFADFSGKARAIAALSLPASHLEKYVVAWLYSFLFFLLVYIGVFYAVDSVVITLAKYGTQQKPVLNLFAREEKAYYSFLLFAAVHSLALWGSLFFEKLAFIKTAVAFFALLMLVSVLNYSFLKSTLGVDLRFSLPFLSADFIENERAYYRLTPTGTQQYLPELMLLVLSALFWLAAYARLREKQL
ncbi:hypothetical protein [Hymenobacter crusticola]|uniref:Uncharacterized protein n=1 Tax=Hymenobacter crusticola TaxID=1770526 RepID=A0A243WA89_9BACT|nr:hypothetical protein [Hymenobacter crusticola]OUJ72474.1 hypothetical protein BXP70_18095 [Hymenobacter crusticola]